MVHMIAWLSLCVNPNDCEGAKKLDAFCHLIICLRGLLDQYFNVLTGDYTLRKFRQVTDSEETAIAL